MYSGHRCMHTDDRFSNAFLVPDLELNRRFWLPDSLYVFTAEVFAILQTVLYTVLIL